MKVLDETQRKPSQWASKVMKCNNEKKIEKLKQQNLYRTMLTHSQQHPRSIFKISKRGIALLDKFSHSQVKANIIFMFFDAISLALQSYLHNKNKISLFQSFSSKTIESKKQKPLHKKHPTKIVLNKKQGQFLFTMSIIKRHFFFSSNHCCGQMKIKSKARSLWSQRLSIKLREIFVVLFKIAFFFLSLSSP